MVSAVLIGKLEWCVCKCDIIIVWYEDEWRDVLSVIV